ncbi:MAG: tRNA guanosine(34) transglycosylase Tgt [Proteobacteria bacterium]|jgi:queuine tRNA-ribosyltransferase|nr:tRNA guanosine(34) transglycosylase Tgt [Pseudomonadota bacterium]MDP6137606.1 tRNA guanosine(34) transglycosylase Tgt [Arenicellales bacterium]HJP08407.1 tRNA guanosine(34) transglycosylase Tgt [Arenicellales bacterium]|tara:strand:- start:19127 stop:20242 length:1116 start_codon:yes stop_codon:yes gene_type:complete
MQFTVTATDGNARRGTIIFSRGEVETPAFMPVGTGGAVRTVAPEEVAESGARVILGNTFHLMLRPGTQVIKAHGTLHDFMHWSGPILTDSGGFQVWSLADSRNITEQGVTFRSPFDGSKVYLGPEESMSVQQDLGSDVVMVFDECTAYPTTYENAESSMNRSLRWARRCRDAHGGEDQALFGIAQGGIYPELRIRSLEALEEIGFDGYALGGLSVGEPTEQMHSVLEQITPQMPGGSPRYLMGVGRPEDILTGVRSGIDLFDCVLPTRNARNGWLYTRDGIVRLKNSANRTDTNPIEEDCRCPACISYSRSYLRHLFTTSESLGKRLCTLHNLWFFGALMEDIRGAVATGTLDSFSRAFLESYLGGGADVA